jgi:microcystin degradation protein MlrC
MRIGILAFLHESNTFCPQPTTMESFEQNTLLTGEAIREQLQDAHHEIGGFFAGLKSEDVTAVPLFAARALPSGRIVAADYRRLVDALLATVRECGPLDGILAAPHGATVSEEYPDADGQWLSELRQLVGPDLPIVATLDAHANLSELMVDAVNAIVAYRTNPHLDQRARGEEAARLLVQTVRGQVRPVMRAAFPPVAISIEQQCTDEPALQPLYQCADRQLQEPGVLSNSILLGFPYSDVQEMGSAAIVITDNDECLAESCIRQLAEQMWQMRAAFVGELVTVADAVTDARSGPRTCLLDMGDNVGGGSAADGTEILEELIKQQVPRSFVCLYDRPAQEACRRAGVGAEITLEIGGRTDDQHGLPVPVKLTVCGLSDGRFSESEPRHGGISEFDQGPTVVAETQTGQTVMLTSRRMVPFSLQQLQSCNLNPSDFQILVAKGVNAPIAAYREVCDRFIRVNTRGSTCADMKQLNYMHRRKPLFPLESDFEWSWKES